MVVESRIRLCEDRLLTICRSIVVLWTKNRQQYGPHRRIRSPANQSPTGSLGETRYRGFGFLDQRLHALVFVETAKGIRVVSFRKANDREVRRYEKARNA